MFRTRKETRCNAMHVSCKKDADADGQTRNAMSLMRSMTHHRSLTTLKERCRPADISKLLENVVYHHLVTHGYDVTVGVLGDKEIDFERSWRGLFTQDGGRTTPPPCLPSACHKNTVKAGHENTVNMDAIRSARLPVLRHCSHPLSSTNRLSWSIKGIRVRVATKCTQKCRSKCRERETHNAKGIHPRRQRVQEAPPPTDLVSVEANVEGA